ncbi:MAG: TldD/PmbA family protein, partial [Actinomycetia bacterium]|nr:TldD/PmbA family protein [Actinomycetes bacterium]
YGVDYADIRIVERKKESLHVKNQVVEEVNNSTDYGFGVRVLLDGCWGFASSFILDKKEVARVVKLAIEISRSSAILKKQDVVLSEEECVKENYTSRFLKNPFKVPIDEKIKLLLGAESLLHQDKAMIIGEAQLKSFLKKQLFLNTKGSEIKQTILACGGGVTATAVGDTGVQRRSFPNSWGDYATKGYEFIEDLELIKNAPVIGEEAVKLLNAPQCPSTEATVVIGSSQLALQIHESIGHPLELDRILGMEASYAGTSFVTLDKFNEFKYGSDIVNVYADATVEGGMGAFGFDDEGVRAGRFDVIKKGILTGVLTSLETSPALNMKSNGCARADGWNRIPLVRMTNINLSPGEKSLEEIIGGIKQGFYLDTNKSWSIDDKRLNFQFAVEKAREIKNGKLGKLYRDANYTGITPNFWNSCKNIGDKKSWTLWGLLNCGKGEPAQIMQVGHGTAPAEFENVKLGVGR